MHSIKLITRETPADNRKWTQNCLSVEYFSVHFLSYICTHKIVWMISKSSKRRKLIAGGSELLYDLSTS